jgi:hypothetical protein
MIHERLGKLWDRVDANLYMRTPSVVWGIGIERSGRLSANVSVGDIVSTDSKQLYRNFGKDRMSRPR